jgi:hypothetical protein
VTILSATGLVWQIQWNVILLVSQPYADSEIERLILHGLQLLDLPKCLFRYYPTIVEKKLGISGTRMTSISYKDDLLRIGSLVVPWWLQALWVLLFVSLVTGYAIWSSGYRFSGRLEIYSRQDDPFNYWITLLYYVGIAGFLTYVAQ